SRVPLRTPVTQTDHAFIAQHGTCARDMPGEIRCWGEDRAVQDVPMAELTNAETLDFGLRHGCGLGEDGIVRCFGESEFGRIGEREDGIIGVNNVAALEVGADHSCVLTAEGEVLCWGYDWAGALGVPKSDLPNCVHGDRGGDCSTIPISPIYVPRTRALSVGAHRTCAIAVAGGVGCWGAWTVNSSVGWCGSNPEECDPFYTEVEGTADAVVIEVGGSVACMIDNEGAVHCWGWGEEGQLGNGRVHEGPAMVPLRVLGFGESVSAER
ncbi:MAG: RCC1 domain-containing protein, partial [Polyangiales bacterium]